MKAKKPLSQAKLRLLELSGKAKTIQSKIKKNGKGDFIIPTINDLVLKMYQREEDVKTFKKYKEWVSEGYKIKKGSKGFAVWSRPLLVNKEMEYKTQEGKKETLEKQLSFFGTAFLFNEKQVEKVYNENDIVTVQDLPF